jgi:hypothetical protein
MLARATRVRALRWKTPYARALERELDRALGEIARLREENRSLLNSILGIAGIPPVTVASPADSAAFKPPAGSFAAPVCAASSATGAQRALDTISAESPRSDLSPRAGSEAPASEPVSPAALANKPSGARVKHLAQVAAPLRRRSWHQINRTLEWEAARKKPQRDSSEA